jgi:hypothetical protein
VALLGTGIELETPATPEECAELVGSKTFDAICSDADYLPLVTKAAERNPDLRIILMTSEGLEAQMPLLKANPAVTNMVSYDAENLTGAIRGLLTTVTKIVSGDIFGLEKYLSWGVEVYEKRIRASSERLKVEEELGADLKKIGIRARIISGALTAAEEMLMNGIYDAPADAQGKALFNHQQRTEEVVLPEGDAVTLRYGCDGVTLAVSVEDPYGSLRRETIIEYLGSNYAKKPQHHGAAEKGGAGRGLYMLTEVSDLVVFNVRKGKCTEVIALFGVHNKNTVATGSVLHYFSA